MRTATSLVAATNGYLPEDALLPELEASEEVRWLLKQRSGLLPPFFFCG